MPQTITLPEDFMPYGPAAVILAIIRRCRERGLPSQITPQELSKLGVADGNIGRVAQTLRFLDLIDEQYNRTQKTYDIEKAQTEKYPEVIAQIIKEAYHSIFEYIDPAVDTDIAIADQFKHYKPASV